jgi:hypothetical protein
LLILVSLPKRSKPLKPLGFRGFDLYARTET